jgi:hypothetical protein
MTEAEKRANELLEAWLRGINEAGHYVTARDIQDAFAVAVRQAHREQEESCISIPAASNAVPD